MQVLAVANQKGGVAKTTTARELGANLAEEGFSVLLIDMDGQHDLTSFFLDDAPDPDVSSVLKGADIRSAVVETGREGLHLLGATEAAYLLDEAVKGKRQAVARALDPVAGFYDVCIIDFPRAASHAAISALECSDAVVIPCEANRASVSNALSMIRLVRDVRGACEVGVLITKSARRSIGAQYEALIRSEGIDRGFTVFDTRIPAAAAVEESEGYGMTLGEYKPNSKPAVAYRELVSEMSEKGFLSIE